jgi:biopolymer transport protein ExbD
MLTPTALTEEPEVLMDINTTPLIDVMLVLLVMLIITIPVQLHAVKLELPVKSQAAEQQKPEVVRISIDAHNQLTWNGQAMDISQLDESVHQIAQSAQPPDLLLHTDKAASYAVFANVLASTRRNGLRRVAVIGNEQFVQ